MATVAISGLPAATGVAGADVTPIVQSATTKKVTFSAIFAAPPAIGGTTPAAGTFTTLSATGAVTFTGTLGLTGSAATLTQSLSAGGTTTSANYWQISNTGGNLYIGVDNYSGVALITGGTAYGSVIGTNNNTTLHLISNGTSIARVTSTGLSVTGTLSATGAVTFTGTNQTTTLGTAGTSTEASAIYLEGGTGAGGGGVVQFQKNGALTGAVAMASRLLGGTTSNMTYYAASGLGHNWYVNGNITVGSPNMSLGSSGGLQMGAPTGADKGAGTANFAADIYKNNTAYTNPDYVLEHWATGQIVKFADKDGAKDYTGLMSLKDTEAFARQNLHLPRFGQQAEHGLFSGSDALLASVEEAYLHLFDHDSRITDLLAWKAKAETALDKAGITI